MNDGYPPASRRGLWIAPHLLGLLIAAAGLLLLTGYSVRDPVGGAREEKRWQNNFKLPPKPAAGLAPRLHLLIRPGFLPPEVLEFFSTSYGTQITTEFFQQNSELKQKLAENPKQFDLVMASDYLIEQLAKEKRLKVLEKSNLGNLGNLPVYFFRLPFDPELRHSVPLFFATLGIVYNSDFVREVPKLNNLRVENPEEDLLLFGHRAIIDEPRVALTAALLAEGIEPNAFDKTALDRVANRLVFGASLLGVRFLSSELPGALAKNDITLALTWSGDAAAARRQNKSIRFNLPARMKLVKVECMAVAGETQHQATAEFFLNYLLMPQISGELTNYSLYANTNEASRRHIQRDILNGPAYLQAAVTSRTYLRYLGEADAEFDRAWARVKANAPEIREKTPLRKSRAENGDEDILAERQPNDTRSKAAATERRN